MNEGNPTPGQRDSSEGDFELAKPAPPVEATTTPPLERPTPLHDPDLYHTPPYGEPGPWSPAPPVQHPAVVPTPQPESASLDEGAQPVPPQGASRVPAGAPQQEPGLAAAPAPRQEARPIPGGPVAPASVPAPTRVSEQAAPPAPGVTAPHVPANTAPPAPEPTTPPAAAHTALTVPGQAAQPTPAQSTPPAPGRPLPPHPQPLTTPPTLTQAAQPLPGHEGQTAVGQPGEAVGEGAEAGGGGDPWQGYDPWAVAADGREPVARGPLQQTGAGVLTRRQREKRGRRLLLVWTAVVAIVSSGVGGLAGAYVEREGAGDVTLPQAGSVPAGRAPDSVAGIAARALPSVVTLHVSGADEAGTGTGFVLDARGHILTNNHVVQAASSGGEISVTFSSGDTAKAKIVGRDSGYDLAVVQVSGVHGLTPLPLGDSDGVRVGDPVVAIGAPFDLANTVTSGIISATERPITAGGEKGDGSDVSYVDALQTDAPINPGNSGGPLLDARARVIGINSAIRSAGTGSDSGSGQAGSIGLGFAIPVNQARRVAEELINEGHATHPVIGVTLDMGWSGDGARVDSKARDGRPAVAEGGPAARAGLKAGDVITEVDGQRVHSGEELIVRIRAHRPGDRLRLTVEHGGEREVSLVLGASEQN
ncbi:S1C family serine protease [Streptomyces collinus]|uniref:S1C family serine protease n=1 Tax=Streptomyces collinus TaxID=42684 RepID=UPI002941D1AF|nr:trypsin-like peptidase domain-containing protein [Streptomyces collinus]